MCFGTLSAFAFKAHLSSLWRLEGVNSLKGMLPRADEAKLPSKLAFCRTEKQAYGSNEPSSQGATPGFELGNAAEYFDRNRRDLSKEGRRPKSKVQLAFKFCAPKSLLRRYFGRGTGFKAVERWASPKTEL